MFNRFISFILGHSKGEPEGPQLYDPEKGEKAEGQAKEFRFFIVHFENEKLYNFLSTILIKPEFNQKMNMTYKKILANVGNTGENLGD